MRRYQNNLLIVILLSSVTSGLGAGAGAALTKLVLAGEKAPGTQGLFRWFGSVDLNDQGQVVLTAALDGTTAKDGVFLLSAAKIEPIALWGQPIPGLPGFVFGGVHSSRIGNDGSVVFACRAVSTNDNGNKMALIVVKGGQTRVAALAGRLPDGTELISFSDYSVAANGRVVFVSSLFSPETGNGRGVFLWDGVLHPVALPGQPHPDGGTLIGPILPRITAQGTYFVETGGQGLLQVLRMTQILVESDGVKRTLFRGRFLDPETGYQLAGMSFPPAFNSSGEAAIVVGQAGGAQRLVRLTDGHTVPTSLRAEPGEGLQFGAFQRVVLNDIGTLVFQGVTASLAERSESITGLYIHSELAGSIEVVREGQAINGFAGSLCKRVRDFNINNHNKLVVSLEIEGALAGEGVFLSQ